MLALINQKTGVAQGNINPVLYRLATNAPAAFHDIVAGGNQVPCVLGTTDCGSGTIGYAAGPGYDLATGIGSVDAANLAAAWPLPQATTPAPAPTPAPTPAPAPSPAPAPTPTPVS